MLARAEVGVVTAKVVVLGQAVFVFLWPSSNVPLSFEALSGESMHRRPLARCPHACELPIPMLARDDYLIDLPNQPVALGHGQVDPIVVVAFE